MASPRIVDGWARWAAGLWLVCIVGALAIGAFGSAAHRESAVEDGPGCPFRTATTLPCAFCGMTHATVALGHGDVGDMFDHHPLAPLVLVGMVLLCGTIVLGRGDTLLGRRWPIVILGAIAAIWIVKLLL